MKKVITKLQSLANSKVTGWVAIGLLLFLVGVEGFKFFDGTSVTSPDLGKIIIELAVLLGFVPEPTTEEA